MDTLGEEGGRFAVVAGSGCAMLSLLPSGVALPGVSPVIWDDAQAALGRLRSRFGRTGRDQASAANPPIFIGFQVSFSEGGSSARARCLLGKVKSDPLALAMLPCMPSSRARRLTPTGTMR